MTDEQIIKEYQEFVNSVNAGGKGEIAQGRFGDILDLIIRQKEKIKEFDGKIVIQQGMIDYQKAEIKELKIEIEELKKRNTLLLKKKCKDINTARKIIKTNAIKEFAERLKEYELCMFCSFPENKSLGSEQYIILSDSIDNLVKEMTKGE